MKWPGLALLLSVCPAPRLFGQASVKPETASVEAEELLVIEPRRGDAMATHDMLPGELVL